MTIVYSNPDPSVAHLVRNALDQIGIEAVVQGDKLGAAMGEVPPIAAWAEVWADTAGREDEVRAVVGDLTRAPTATEPWTCGACGETVEASFGTCWMCGTDAPVASA